MSSTPTSTLRWGVAGLALSLPAAVLALGPSTTTGAAAAAAPVSTTGARADEPAPAPEDPSRAADGHIHLRGVDVDTSVPVPATHTPAIATDGGQQLRLVQLAGPTRPAWYDDLAATGRVVTYIPDHAYLIWTSDAGVSKLDRQARAGKSVVYSAPFDPAYRVSPDLVAKDATVDVTVQTVDVPAGASELDAVTAGRTVLRDEYALGGLRTVSLTVPSDQVDDIAQLPAVVNVEPYVAPHLTDEAQDQLLAGMVTTSSSGVTVPSGPGYLTWLASHGFVNDPAAYPKVAVVDDGIDNGSVAPLHADFYRTGVKANGSRLTGNDNCTADASADGGAGHGNLNAGIVGGYNDTDADPYQDARGYKYGLGVSPFGRVSGVKIFRNSGSYSISACGNSDAGVVAKAYAAGAGLTSNSWGASVNGAYDASARAYDLLTRDASSTAGGNQQMLHVFSAGNDGAGPTTIGSPGTAKNVLVVGATENVREDGTLDGCAEGNADDDSDMATFSSRGPTSDGRSKPDVVAAGTHVMGPASQATGYTGGGVCGDGGANNRYHPVGQTLYTWSSGTSHSTPAIAGAASLVQNYYGRVLQPGATASPAMLKALLVNAPRYLDGEDTGDTLPSNNQGWGVPNLGELFGGATHRYVADQSTVLTASGQQQGVQLTVTDPTKPVRVTLAWTDAAGPTTGAAYVNDLDLRVTVDGHLYRGNVFAGGLSTTGGTADAKNNVENVFLPAGTTGRVSVSVRAANIAGDGVPGNGSALDQDFALTASNVDPAPTPAANPAAAGVVVHDSDFDANTTFERGETVTVDASVFNGGDAASAAGTGTLTVVGGSATVVRGTSPYGAVAPEATGTNTQQYVVQLADDATCGGTVTLRHTWTAGGRTSVEDTTLRVGPAMVPDWAAATTTPSTDVPKSIPDASAAGVDSIVTVAGGAPVGGVRVKPTITHAYDRDLVLTLVAPSGHSVLLVSRRGGNGDNFSGTVLDDAAAAAISAGVAPFTGSIRPEQPLSALTGESSGGVWKLHATDVEAPDAGSITGWSLDVAPLVQPACSAPGPSVQVLPPLVTGEKDGSVLVPVTLLHPDAAPHSVTFTPTAGTATATADFDPAPVTVTWAPGDPATKHVAIPLVDDGIAESEETFTVAASASTIPVSAAVTARITDGGQPLTVAVADAPAVSEGGTLSFPVTLSGPDRAGPVSVHIATGGGTASAGGDYTAVDRTLTWAPGDPATQVVTVATANDTAVEPDETVVVILSGPGGTPVAPVLGKATATGTVKDAVVPPTPPAPAVPSVTVKKAKVTEGDKGKQKLTFAVSLSGPTSVPVTFTWATQDLTAKAGSDYKKASGTVTVAPGATTATITVLVKGDRRAERNEKLSLLLFAIAHGTFAGPTTVKGKIVDDD
ncbi:S8 family serine peptidase [Nocardioides anomalus]|uniref:S8 family serine peptidase n=1 Tax=Nocardioides anomalus TaxID=2712223 RepID=A0A6G6WHY9_9ACTN|nr:S8 family serine peptidase [Nocardioides anomalus]QIG44951.1 S8 family serine peptidase [Nocardioides anomalus]